MRLDVQPTYRAFGGSESLDVFPSPLPLFPKVTDLSGINKSLQSFHISHSSPSQATGPVQDCPSYFEANSSFLTNRSPQETWNSVLLTLEGVDHIYKPLKNMVKGLYYDDAGSPCSFIIRLFKAPSGSTSKHLLEIQRRFGCQFAFRKLYQQMLKSLAVQGGTPFNPPSSSSTSPPPPPPLGQTVLDKQTRDNLYRGLGANLEHAREVMRLLSSCAKNSENRAVLADSESSTNLWDIISHLLECSKDGEILRNTASFLSCMAIEQSLRTDIISKLLSKMFTIIEGPKIESAGFGQCGDFLDFDTKRLLVHTVALTAETHAKQIIQSPLFSQYSKTLTNLQSSDDNALRGDVILTLKYLKAH